ncbi:AMP-binding protein [Gordonia sp. VNK1]|uniref:AMP-binding protein n=1 Tax=Gordonia oleivorans TaxID=3156618 RepID=UPI0032B3DE8D
MTVGITSIDIAPSVDEDRLLKLLVEDGEIVTERLDHWVRERPDARYLYYGEDATSLTYAEFGTLTDTIAGNLAAHGAVKGERVSVLTTNSYLAAVMMFAIWKCGAIYCPVNFAYTGRLLAYQLDDTAPRLLITDTAHLSAINDVAADLAHRPTLVVHSRSAGEHGEVPDADPRFTTIPWASLVAQGAARPDVEILFDDPANIVYTSGTTGPAKGVVQPYRWMAQYTFGLRSLLTRDDVIYSDLPMYHVGGAIANVARAAWVGCAVAIWDRFSPNDFWDRIAISGSTSAILLDVMIPWLMNADPRADDRVNTLNKVYMQPLPQHHAEVASRFGFDLVMAGFGQTESGATVNAFIVETAPGEGTPATHYRGLSHAEITERADQRGIRVLSGAEVTEKGFMGSPGPFCEVSIRGEHDRECAVGEPGQLVLRPRLPGLTMLGYHGKPEATVAAWRNLWLHTGDAAVCDADGTFVFVDWLGDRIRVRGENLSSYQVEDLVNQHPAVQFCAAFAIPSDSGTEDDVVVYVVPADGVALTAEIIHQHAESVMPKYMRPRIVRVVSDLPRTATNKIEKYRLRRRILDELAGPAGSATAPS